MVHLHAHADRKEWVPLERLFVMSPCRLLLQASLLLLFFALDTSPPAHALAGTDEIRADPASSIRYSPNESEETEVPFSPPPLLPPAQIEVRDKPLDAGKALIISFDRSASDGMGHGPVAGYEVHRKGPADTEYSLVRRFDSQLLLESFSTEDGGLRPGTPYTYIVRVIGHDGDHADSKPFGPIAPRRQWLYTNKINTLVATAMFVAFILIYIDMARRGKPLFIRRIAGLDALDEAVGRCTEMGKPTLYVPGISTISDVSTIASLNILGQVAKKIAAYQSRILVPNRDPIVYPVTQDIVKQGFTEAGYPHNYNDDDVFFVTNDQFSYAAAVCGIMAREKPGANLLLGMFYAESLVLAETGASIGAIQIAGTDSTAQLPFFVAACDYTIMGEELYAASSYISREPTLLGSLKGQDYYKLIVLLIILVGALLMTLGVIMRGEPFDWVADTLRVRGTGG